MIHLKSNEQRAKNAILLIWIVLIIEIISFISGYFQYNLIKIVALGEEISTEAADANDIREQIIGIIYLIAFIISAITFIKWFRRAYYNLHIKVNKLTFNEGWAAGCWFIPIVSLYRPYQIMRELFNETKVLFEKNDIKLLKPFSINLLGLWWTLWIINNFVSQFAYRYSLKAETIDELINTTKANMIGNLIGVMLALITIKVIRDYSNIESLFNELKEEEEANIVTE